VTRRYYRLLMVPCYGTIWCRYMAPRFWTIAPVALLDLAVEYGANVAKVADEVMSIAERSHVSGPLIAATEQDIGVWFADQAARAPGHREDQLAALIDAMRDAIGANAAQDILARAGLTDGNRS
jgi:hypothetical protein